MINMNKNLNFYTQVKQLIAEDNLAEALSQLQAFLSDSPKLDEIILQTARFSDIRRQIRLGLSDSQEANLTKNQIRAGLLDLLNELEKQDTQEQGNQAHEGAKTTVNKTINQTAEKIYNIEKIDKADFS